MASANEIYREAEILEAVRHLAENAVALRCDAPPGATDLNVGSHKIFEVGDEVDLRKVGDYPRDVGTYRVVKKSEGITLMRIDPALRVDCAAGTIVKKRGAPDIFEQYEVSEVRGPLTYGVRKFPCVIVECGAMKQAGKGEDRVLEQVYAVNVHCAVHPLPDGDWPVVDVYRSAGIVGQLLERLASDRFVGGVCCDAKITDVNRKPAHYIGATITMELRRVAIRSGRTSAENEE